MEIMFLSTLDAVEQAGSLVLPHLFTSQRFEASDRRFYLFIFQSIFMSFVDCEFVR